jgi:hypothetical protein
MPSKDMITLPRAEERMAYASSLTLGDVATKLESELPSELAADVRSAVTTRNFLAHHFWYERAHLMFAIEDVHTLISELDGYAKMFNQLDARVSEWSKPIHEKFGLTDEKTQAALEQILAGVPDDPLPDKQTVRDLERKLSRRQRLFRVWEFSLEDGRKPMIFELADGSLWQRFPKEQCFGSNRDDKGRHSAGAYVCRK